MNVDTHLFGFPCILSTVYCLPSTAGGTPKLGLGVCLSNRNAPESPLSLWERARVRVSHCPRANDPLPHLHQHRQTF